MNVTGEMMWFLIKGSVWLTVVLVALSFFSATPDNNAETTPPFEVAGAVTAASGLYQYVSQICFEKPDVCEKGANTISALGHRAREGAYVAIGFLDSQLGEDGSPVKDEQTASLTDTVPAIALEQPMPQELVTGTIAPNIPVPLQRPRL